MIPERFSISNNFGTYFGIWTSLLLAVGAGTLALTDVIPADWIPRVKNIALFFGMANSIILTGLHAVSGAGTGPLVKGDGK